MKPTGVLIVFEGNDGAGKTIVLQAVAKNLKEKGMDVLTTREPGGAPISEQIRTVLLDCANEMDAKTEALLYAASRREHLVKTLLPALSQGRIVLCDRFLDSSLAYQGGARGLGFDAIEELNDFGLEGFRPDLTLFFGLDEPTQKKRRIQRGNQNRLDLESDLFHHKVNQAFDALLEQGKEPRVFIDASKPLQEVIQEVTQKVEAFLAHKQAEAALAQKQLEVLRSRSPIEVFLAKKQLEAFLTKKQLDQTSEKISDEVELSPWVEALEEAFLEGVGPKAQALLELFLQNKDLKLEKSSSPLSTKDNKEESVTNAQ